MNNHVVSILGIGGCFEEETLHLVSHAGTGICINLLYPIHNPDMYIHIL